jgi:hypothetical protein
MHYGIKVVSVTIGKSGPNRKAHAEVEGRYRSARAREECAATMLAGRETERLYFAEPLPEGTDADDLEYARWVLELNLKPWQSDDDLANYIARLPKRTHRLVRPIVRYNIHLIYKALLKRTTLKAADIDLWKSRSPVGPIGTPCA